jgi:hypothetical protein
MGESGRIGDEGACGAGRDDVDCLPGKEILLVVFDPANFLDSDGLCTPIVVVGFAQIAPLGFHGGEYV